MLHLFIAMFLFHGPAKPETIIVELEVPFLDVSPYHRPYIAVWLETTDRQGVETISLWAEQEEWHKDLRQWWRKLGRKNNEIDGVSGATRKPGRYQFKWEINELRGKVVTPGEYFLNFEAAREEGGRDFIRQKVTLGKGLTQQYQLKGDYELADVIIKIQ